MKQVYDMSAEEIRELVKQYIEHGVISRAIQCYERLLWLGELQKCEYSKLIYLYKRKAYTKKISNVIDRYINFYI